MSGQASSANPPRSTRNGVRANTYADARQGEREGRYANLLIGLGGRRRVHSNAAGRGQREGYEAEREMKVARLDDD